MHLKTGKGSPVLSQLAWVDILLIKMIRSGRGERIVVMLIVVVESTGQDDKSMVNHW